MNSFSEAMKALDEGKAVRPVIWPCGSKLWMEAGRLMAKSNCGEAFPFAPFAFIFTPNYCKWEIYV